MGVTLFQGSAILEEPELQPCPTPPDGLGWGADVQMPRCLTGLEPELP